MNEADNDNPVKQWDYDVWHQRPVSMVDEYDWQLMGLSINYFGSVYSDFSDSWLHGVIISATGTEEVWTSDASEQLRSAGYELDPVDDGITFLAPMQDGEWFGGYPEGEGSGVEGPTADFGDAGETALGAAVGIVHPILGLSFDAGSIINDLINPDGDDDLSREYVPVSIGRPYFEEVAYCQEMYVSTERTAVRPSFEITSYLTHSLSLGYEKGSEITVRLDTYQDEDDGIQDPVPTSVAPEEMGEKEKEQINLREVSASRDDFTDLTTSQARTILNHAEPGNTVYTADIPMSAEISEKGSESGKKTDRPR